MSADWCMAAGDIPNMYHWDGSSWTRQTFADVQYGQNDIQIRAISCVSPTFCAVVGSQFVNHEFTPFAAEWDGTNWSSVPIPAMAGSSPQDLSLTCVSATFCLALGYSYPGQIYDEWNGSTWSAIPVTGALTGYYTSISCATTTSCVAVGETGYPSTTPLAVSYDGTAWTADTVPNLQQNSALTTVSCVSPTWCEAVGSTTSPTGIVSAMADHWDGSTWTAQQLTSFSKNTVFSATVSCPSTTFCAAAYTSQPGANVIFDRGQIEEYSNGVWSAPATPNPTVDTDVLLGISCSDVDTCAAVGSTDDLNDVPRPLFISDYQPALDTSTDRVSLVQPGPVYGTANEYGKGEVTVVVPTALLDGVPDPNAKVRCNQVGTPELPIGATSITCEADDANVQQDVPASTTYQAIVSPGPQAGLELDPSLTTIILGTSQTYTAYSIDQYRNDIADVSASTTLTGPGCTGSVCQPPQAGFYSIGASEGGYSATARLVVAKVPVAASVVGRIVNHTTVVFSSEVTLPDGSVHVATGVTCAMLPGFVPITPALGYGTYTLDPTWCTSNPIDDTYQPYFTSATLTSALFGITRPYLLNSRVGAFYSASLTCGGAPSCQWAVVGGALPPGLKLSTAGTISGTSTTVGTYAFTVSAKSGANSQTWPYTITIAPKTAVIPMFITTGWAPSPVIGKAYSLHLQSAGGSGTKTWTIVDGSLPPGLTMSSAGVINGTPSNTNGGAYDFTVTVKDSAKPADTYTRTFWLLTYFFSIRTPSPLRAGKVGTYYSQTFATDGGTAPFRWEFFRGALPPGLNLSIRGVLSGTPTQAGTYTFTIRAYDKNDNYADAQFAMTVT